MVTASGTEHTAKTLILEIGQQTNKDYSSVVQALEENDIVTLDDLIDREPEQYKELGVNIGLANKVKKALIKHRSADTAETVRATRLLARSSTLAKAQNKSLVKPGQRIFLLIGNRDYSDRRKEEGYEAFGDLDAVEDDLRNTKDGLVRLGVKSSEIIVVKDIGFK